MKFTSVMPINPKIVRKYGVTKFRDSVALPWSYTPPLAISNVAFLPFSNPSLPAGRVRDGLAHSDDLVDPEFQRGRNAEIVHRNPKDVLVGLLQFRNQHIGDSQHLLLFGCAGVFGCVCRGRPAGVDDRDV